VTSSGTSGHPASGHYNDQQEAWLAGDSFPWAFSRTAVEAAGEDTMTLTARRD
jgi:penicillin amidase